ncbi:hypothetical protein F4801DRAFT_393253 [Xylaria longipes]|nr:hypothetical protein F4801DRAFT_393253 [Xylaria longipes]
MPPQASNLAPPPQAKRGVNQGDEGNLTYRHSSVLMSSHASSDAGDVRSSSIPINSTDDQLSTEPVPADFVDFDLFMSFPPCTQQEAPVTALSGPNQTDSGDSVDSSHQVEKPKSKIDETGNNERQLRPRLARQNSPIRRARERQAMRCISGFDGSVEGHSSADGEGSASSALETKCSKANADDDDDDDDDDEYQLSESENDKGDSEESTINEIIKNPRKTTNKKPAKMAYSSKPRGKQAAKAKTAPVTAKKVSRPVANKVAVSARKRPVAPKQIVRSPERLSTSLDEFSPVRQNMKASVGSSKQKRRDVVPDSQDIVTDSQKNAIPLKAKSIAMNNRRPKKPFYRDSLGAQQTNLDPTTAICSTTDTHQQSTARQGKVLYSPPYVTGLQGNREVQASSQSKRTAPNPRQSEATRPRGNNDVGPKIDKGKGRAMDQTQPPPTTYEVGSPPINQSSDQPSQFDNAEHLEMRLQSSTPCHTEAETSQRTDSSEPSELPVNEIKVAPVVRESFKHIDVSTQAHLPRLSPGPVWHDHVVETKNAASQTSQSLHKNIYSQEEFEEGVVGNDTTGHWLLRSPRVQDASGPSRVIPTAARVQKEREQAEKLGKDPSMKPFRDHSIIETPLHPISRAWAQGVAKRSRQNKSKVSAPQTNAGETEPLGRTPRTIIESHKNLISRRENALGNQRNAIIDSIQEITMAVLQHLKSKESAIDSIVGIYQQSGRQVLDMLLDRQSIELRQAASDFDGKCIRLENLFEKSARHAKAIDKMMSNENDRHLRDWERRSKELEETIKLAKDAVSSI